MNEGRKVRSANGLIPWHSEEEHGFTLQRIKEWRAIEDAAGRPSGLDDFFASHGLCFDCGACGVQMVGWSDPITEIDIQGAEEIGLSQLPLYAVCQTCKGTGKAERAVWSSR
jgi:hypothetical protein